MKYGKGKRIKVPQDDLDDMEIAYARAKDIEIEDRDVPAYALGGKWCQKRRSALENLKIETALKTIESEVKEGRKVVLFATRASESYISVPEGDEVQQRIAALVTDGVVAKTTVETDDNGLETVVKHYKQTESTVKKIEDGLKKRGIKSVSLSSAEVDPEDRRKGDQKIEDFQTGDAQVFVTTPQSGGTGINLDDTVGDKPRTAVIMTPPFSGLDLTQMLGRVHRLTTKSKSRALVLSAEGSATDAWNSGICDAKMKSLGAAVGGDVGRNLNPDILKLVGGMDDDEAAAFLENLKSNPDSLKLEGSESVAPFKAEDFVSPANQMTNRTFGMNDVDVLKEYGMFVDGDVQANHVIGGPFGQPGFAPEGMMLPANDKVNWTLPVNKRSSVGRILASRSLAHPEIPQFYVVVGKDKEYAYAKPISRDIDNSTALRAMVKQRYGRLFNDEQIDKFLEGLNKDVGIKKSLRKARRVAKSQGREIPQYNGSGYIGTPSIDPLSQQLMFALVRDGTKESAAKLMASNVGEFMDNVTQ